MTHSDDVVAERVRGSAWLLKGLLEKFPTDDLLGLDGIQAMVDASVGWFERAAIEAIFDTPTERGERCSRRCPCRRLSRARDSKPVRVCTKRFSWVINHARPLDVKPQAGRGRLSLRM